MNALDDERSKQLHKEIKDKVQELVEIANRGKYDLEVSVDISKVTIYESSSLVSDNVLLGINVSFTRNL